jgi:hypothetical protein
MPSPRAVVAVALAVALGTALPLQGGGVLDLTVIDVTAGRVVYAGKLAAMASVALGDLAQGAAHRYRFAVAFPTGPPAFDNQLQVAATTVSFLWSAGAVAPASAVVTPTAPAPPSAGTLGRASRPQARLAASRRQRGRAIRVQLTCEAACRARFTARARVGPAGARLRAATRTLRREGRVTVGLALPRRTAAALAAGRRATVRVVARVSVGGRTHCSVRRCICFRANIGGRERKRAKRLSRSSTPPISTPDAPPHRASKSTQSAAVTSVPPSREGSP